MWCRSIQLLALVATLGVFASAQDSSITLRSYSRLVEVSVVVKKDGKHVSGLSGNDFVLYENGKPQRIAAFEESTEALPANRLDSAAAMQPGHYTNAAETSRGIAVIVIDSINTPVLDQTYARQHMIKFLREAHFPQDQPIGLMVSARGGLKVVHHFTTDTSVLVAALNAVKGESPSSSADPAPAVAEEIRSLQGFSDQVDAPAFYCEMALRDTVRVFRELAHTLRGFPGRKTVLWATAGFPFQCGSVTFADLSGRAFRELADANVSIYPVDARGLLAYDFMSADPSTRMTGTQARNPGAYNLQRYSGWFRSFRNSIESLQETAERTGGIAFYNTNGISQALNKAMVDSADYYVLGYYTQAGDAKQAEWRNIQVKSRVRGITLRHRSGVYILPSADTNKKDDLDLAQTSPLDFSGLAFTLVWPSGNAADTSAYDIEIDSRQLTLSDDDQLSVDVLAVERKDSGEIVLRKSNTISGKVKDRSLFLSKPFHFSGRMEPPSPGTTIRFIVRDNFAQRMGSVTARLPPQPR